MVENTTAPIIITRKLYFNKKEREEGEGFYPMFNPPLQIYKENEYQQISVSFELKKGTEWHQRNRSVIYGLEGINGPQLLVSLNNEAKVNGYKIFNSGGRQIFPVTANSTFRILNQYNN